jgi:hypothetical protein
MYCRPVFVPIAAALVECDSRGLTGSDYALFRYERLARPVYPLDGVDRWDGAGRAARENRRARRRAPSCIMRLHRPVEQLGRAHPCVCNRPENRTPCIRNASTFVAPACSPR